MAEASAAADLASVVQVSCGSSHTVALLDCNVVASWGRGEDGQLGHGDAEQVDAPRAVHALLGADVSAVCCGAEYTVAVSKQHRRVYSWGWGDFGRLGHGDCTDVFVPRLVDFFNGMAVKQVACGDTHTLVCTDSGELYTFGRNQNGQLGHGNTNDLLSPQRVAGLQGKVVTSVAGGAEHSVIATDKGEVYAWGWGRYGNLGDGDRQDRHAPAAVNSASIDSSSAGSVTSVACGWRHSAAVTSDGRVFTFGWSKYGQLGLGDHEDRLVPAEVSGLAGRHVVAIAGGWRHTMALDSEGGVWAWGWNKFGQLGIGSTEDQASPVAVSSLAGSPIAQLACGWRHTVAVGRAGQVFSWGRGVNGQLGHGLERDEARPRTLAALCRGAVNVAGLVASARPQGGYVAPADRYAVVPSGENCGGDAGVPEGLPDSAVPEMVEVPGVPDSSSTGLLGNGSGLAGECFSGEGGPPAKRQHVAAPAGSADDAAVPGS